MNRRTPNPVPSLPFPFRPGLSPWGNIWGNNMEWYSLTNLLQHCCCRKEWILKKLTNWANSLHPCNLMNSMNPEPRPTPSLPFPFRPRLSPWGNIWSINMECYSLTTWLQHCCWRKEWILKKLTEIKQTPFYSRNLMNSNNSEPRPVPLRPVPDCPHGVTSEVSTWNVIP